MLVLAFILFAKRHLVGVETVERSGKTLTSSQTALALSNRASLIPLTQSARVRHKSPKGIKFPMFNSCPLTNKLDGLPASGGKDQRGAIKKAILRKHLYRAAINENEI
jgi:hypothetical protein